MKKILASLLTVSVLIVLCLFVSCGKNETSKTESKAVNFSEVKPTSMTAELWPAESFDISKADDLNKIMTCLNSINFSNEIKSSDVKTDLDGSGQTFEIKSTSGTISISLYNDTVIISDSKMNTKKYCRITTDEYEKLYKIVVANNPQFPQ